MDGIVNLIMSCYPQLEVHPCDLSRTLKNTRAMDALVEQGYLHLSVDGRFYIPDEKAIPYLTERGFVTNTLQFVDGRSIRYENDDKTKATVQCLVKRGSITPFGNRKGFREGDIELYSVGCEKYDDGWRIITTAKGTLGSGETMWVGRYNFDCK